MKQYWRLLHVRSRFSSKLHLTYVVSKRCLTNKLYVITKRIMWPCYISGWLFNTACWARTEGSLCGICDGQSGSGALYAGNFGLLMSNVVHSAITSYSFTYRLEAITLGSLLTNRAQFHHAPTVNKIPNLLQCRQVCILFILVYYIIKIYYSYKNMKHFHQKKRIFCCNIFSAL
jgi:hypothetical protein